MRKKKKEPQDEDKEVDTKGARVQPTPASESDTTPSLQAPITPITPTNGPAPFYPYPPNIAQFPMYGPMQPPQLQQQQQSQQQPLPMPNIPQPETETESPQKQVENSK